MSLTEKQRGVLTGMVLGVITAIAIVVVGAWLNPFSFGENLDGFDRIRVAIESALLPGLIFAVSVGRLARHRFFTPEDIDGGGLSVGTEEAHVLQSLLQNTLEQFAIALVVYLAWAVIMPANWLSVLPLAGVAFIIGRILFFSGYKKGAPSRAYGFTLSFFPSLLMLVITVVFFLWQLIN